MCFGRLILALADGITYREIARGMKTSGPTVARWKMRFEQDGVAGLRSSSRQQAPRGDSGGAARVIRRVQQNPETAAPTGPAGNWRRSWGSESPCSGFWHRPTATQRLERYMAVTIRIRAKAADIIGLYLDRRSSGVFCVDEKTRFRLWTARPRAAVVAGSADAWLQYTPWDAIVICG